MKVASLTRAQYTALQAPLDAIAAAQAKRATKIGRRIPPNKRPPATYARGARGWSSPDTPYPQSTGAVVVTLTGAAWAALNPAQRALFVDLPDDAEGNPIYPDGFAAGEVAAGAQPVGAIRTEGSR